MPPVINILGFVTPPPGRCSVRAEGRRRLRYPAWMLSRQIISARAREIIFIPGITAKHVLIIIRMIKRCNSSFRDVA